ncbi:MAG TPA: PTS sugar transporter subunit IIA [Thermodesulfobacteriota bacterium]|nr:PTS sugar transporter subunit IIA [Thermodesulfobacteriota bacterium]
MVGAIIVTHGNLAASLVEVAESITGKMENVRTVSVLNSDTTESIRGTISGAIKEVNSGSGVIIFTDMFGGTPTNVALSLLEDGRVDVITGVNLPMLIKFIGNRTEKSLAEVALLLKDYGQKSIVLAGDMLKDKK